MQRVPPLSRFEASPFRNLLVEWLRDIAVGEIASYADLAEVCGADPQTAGRSLIYSARNALLKERIAFDVVTNIGLKRLDDSGKVAAAEGHLDKGKNAAKRSIRLLRASDFAALSPAEQTRYAVAEVRAGATLQFASKRTVKQLEGAVAGGTTTRQLKGAVQDTFAQFNGQ